MPLCLRGSALLHSFVRFDLGRLLFGICYLEFDNCSIVHCQLSIVFPASTLLVWDLEIGILILVFSCLCASVVQLLCICSRALTLLVWGLSFGIWYLSFGILILDFCAFVPPWFRSFASFRAHRPCSFVVWDLGFVIWNLIIAPLFIVNCPLFFPRRPCSFGI